MLHPTEGGPERLFQLDELHADGRLLDAVGHLAHGLGNAAMLGDVVEQFEVVDVHVLAPRLNSGGSAGVGLRLRGANSERRSGGERGIRTLGTELTVQRFSKPSLSTTQPSLLPGAVSATALSAARFIVSKWRRVNSNFQISRGAGVPPAVRQTGVTAARRTGEGTAPAAHHMESTPSMAPRGTGPKARLSTLRLRLSPKTK